MSNNDDERRALAKEMVIREVAKLGEWPNRSRAESYARNAWDVAGCVLAELDRMKKETSR
jgi:hypothetical protein